MDTSRIIEFIGNHYLLCGVFLALLVVLAITEIRRGGRSIGSAQLTSLLNSDQAIIVDIRSSKDFGAGHITDSVNIPFDKFTSRVVELNKYKENKVIVIVDSQGQQSGPICRDMKKSGFNVAKLGGGIANWKADGLPLVKKKAKA
ncbi:rhodanese-like domain-containing protein [Entomomonas asaccharolytica]|uniref:Rhodanese-like domain-containing protein n=1 Tax=Entomomonas asaccharolytica TaxID=2785331 RepID=A0A974NFZ3_9GAMM|nr:rhodanese-like domain-containing protein [Entomomonas asaccharolytica]QQP85870.1 rhodanese-like domain-containing protein [Entomomonas asaccharolytica]